MIWRVLLFVGMCIGIGAAFWAPDADLFSQPALARIVFFHLPEAIACSLFLFGGSYFSFRVLRDRQLHWDLRASSCMQLVLVLGVLTLMTGILFSKVQWLKWWGWDPRQTSFLLVMLIIGAYFALRSAYSDEAKRASFSAAYALATLLPILFLLFVYPRLPSTISLHPETKLTTTFDPTYKAVYWGLFVMIFSTSAWLYRMSVRVGLLTSELEKAHGELANRDDSAPTGVVRTISVSSDGG